MSLNGLNIPSPICFSQFINELIFAKSLNGFRRQSTMPKWEGESLVSPSWWQKPLKKAMQWLTLCLASLGDLCSEPLAFWSSSSRHGEWAKKLPPRPTLPHSSVWRCSGALCPNFPVQHRWQQLVTAHITLVMGASIVMECILAIEEWRLCELPVWETKQSLYPDFSDKVRQKDSAKKSQFISWTAYPAMHFRGNL